MSTAKNSIALTVFLVISGISAAFAQITARQQDVPAAKEITFVDGKWKEVAAQARKSGKYIFVDAYTTWCLPCRQLKNVTFKDEAAAAYFNEHFINCAFDMEKGEGIQLADQWEIMAYPALLFFTPEGKMIMKQVGYIDGKQLLAFGKQALARK
ncbi:thioredoxin family protein [uncultured Chitinophaga sp.]|jgi:Thioredoxin-related protein|uniref:thioredoxin family protein n=1 Tax=uncultured Chitinophaga sp. TaxID=339340 RepID=UPI002609F5F8|nr:thioredoxin family protein [uncultured Chitinophaga sp.]